MAWHYGTFSCGHEGRVNITGPTKNRQWIADRKFEGMCEECYLKHLEEEKVRKNKEALEAAKEMELPELKGTEKQVPWAITLRQDFIDKLSKKADEYESDERPKRATKIRLSLDYMINNKIESKFYIDNRSEYIEDIITLLYKEYKENLETQKENIETKEVIEEGTIAPKEIKFSGIVKIVATTEKVTVFYEKNEKFREIVKNLNFKWEESKWERKLSELTGTYIDRAAELGNKLLNAGFIICILDEKIRNKAINGEFEVECDRWIKSDIENNKLIIKWYEKNDYMYNAARKIKTSKWNSDIKAVTINISHFSEVQEFAEIYKCNFTEKALNFIEQYKNELANVKKVEPVKTKDNVKEDGLKNILNSSREVLDDLREDD